MDTKPENAIVLPEFVVPPGNEPHPSKLIDIEMLFPRRSRAHGTGRATCLPRVDSADENCPNKVAVRRD